MNSDDVINRDLFWIILLVVLLAISTSTSLGILNVTEMDKSINIVNKRSINSHYDQNKSFQQFLDQYYAANITEQPTILEEYIAWQETDGGGFPAIQSETHAVFIYYNASILIESCEIVGDFTAWNSIPMIRLSEGVSFFYFELTNDTQILNFEVPLYSTSRIDYLFIIDGLMITDPRNPLQSPLSYGENCSELAMPDFQQPSEIIYRSNIPHGTVTKLQSPWNNPIVQVYLPPDYDAGNKYPTIYTGDGSDYISLMSAVNVIDNLIADKRIQPIIGIFINPIDFVPYEEYDIITRINWYKCNPEYLTYLDDLVEYIDNTYSANTSSYARLHLGYSISGLTSTYVLLERPELFKLLACQSGSLRYCSTHENYENAPVSYNFKTWFSIGTYESNNNFDVPMVELTEEIATICDNKGWQTELCYLYGECHSYGAWRHVLDEMLEYFFPYQEKPTRSASATYFSFNLFLAILFLKKSKKTKERMGS